MNSKQECIAKAYGEYWDKFKLLVDENGAISNKDFSFIDAEDIMEIFCYYHIGFNGETVGVEKWIPLSLAGIENNNGWIKIESEESLPTKEGKYIWGRLHKESEYGPEWFEQFKETTKEGIIKAYKFYIRVTHYKEVFDHEPPLH